MKTPKCYQCGFCCRQGSCYYGTFDVIRKQCIYLTPNNKCAKYEEILKKEKDSTFPMARNTGKLTDLVSVHNDPQSKGKAVTFTWKKATFKLTENLKAYELDFTNTYVKSELSAEVEAAINAKLHPVA